MTDPIPEVFRQGTCAYCGAVSDVTNDHVIPNAYGVGLGVSQVCSNR